MVMSPGALPEYRSSIFIDGYTYQLSVYFSQGEQPAGMLMHSHSRYELHAIIEGDAVLEFESEPVLTLKSGDCCIIAPHIYHLRRVKPGAGQCFVMFISCPKGAPLQLQDTVCLRCAPELIRLFRALAEENKKRRIGSDSVVQSLCTLLLVAILRELTAPLQQQNLPARASVNLREDLIDNYFAKNYGSETTAGDLAEKLGITTRQLARIMQQRYGCTFRQHLLEIRMYHARSYLTTTDMPVCEISSVCGFADQGAFATAFRRCVGCTPTQYRRKKGELME